VTDAIAELDTCADHRLRVDSSFDVVLDELAYVIAYGLVAALFTGQNIFQASFRKETAGQQYEGKGNKKEYH
jgi:hypothetical protein